MARAESRPRRASRRCVLVLASMLGAVAGLARPVASNGQALETRISAARGAAVEFEYASRPEVCGNGRDVIIIGSTVMAGSSMSMGYVGGPHGACEHGPLSVTLVRQDGRITALHTSVGAHRPTGQASIGTVADTQAVAYLLTLAAHAPDRVSADAITAAALADSVTIWPALLRFGRDSTHPREAGKRALYWSGQLGGEAVVPPLDSVARDSPLPESLREAAVFALTEVPDGAGVSRLISLARSGDDQRLATKATFWLGQTDDDRAHAALRELVTETTRPEEIRGEAIFALSQRASDQDATFLRTIYPTLGSTRLEERVLQAMAESERDTDSQWLLGLATSRDESIEMRKQALFWAGQGHASTSSLTGLYARLGDHELQEHLIFVLSQRDDRAATAKLIEIARTDPDRDLRKKAIFWLGQKGDPEAMRALRQLIEQ